MNREVRTENKINDERKIKVVKSADRNNTNINDIDRNSIIDAKHCNNIYQNNLDADNNNIPIHQKLTLTIKEAAAYSNIGITKLYEMTNNPKCNFVIYTGTRKRLIKRKEFENYISKCTFI